MTDKPKLDLTKPICTRSGEGKVVIYCTDAPGDYPIHGRIDYGETHHISYSEPRCWDKYGRFDRLYQNKFDLVNLPEPLEVWLNIYEGNGSLACGCGHQTKMKADESSGHNRIGCVRVLIDKPRRFDE